MGIRITPEDQIEMDLIEALSEGRSQWKFEPEIRTEEQLWDNFFNILSQNNVSRLKDNPLTDDEKSQIRTALNFATFYDAGEWLSGENGIAQVRIQRTDAQLGIIHLMVHNANDIAGGTSVYQVVHQIQRDKQSEMDRNRRTDVSLLINGLPLIHIELKSRSGSTLEAFEQIKKYDAERKFRGIYSMIQTFIVSNGSNTQYIAADKHYHLNKLFLTTWVRENNEPVRELLAFTKDVLTIPMGHELVTDYTVLDSKRKKLIALRPYQIHATKSILDAMNRDESGHIWHTTGSGKTLTSYKTSKTILRRNSLDKVLFLVDRKELDTQTTNEFQSYAENDTIDVEDTSNVRSLVAKLIDGNREVIVTTAQKLNYLIKRYEKYKDTLTKKQQRERDQLRSLRLAYVVDECHRAVSAEQKRIVDRFFMQPVKLWYGFTGTPIFKSKNVKGDLEATTDDQYGPALHTYTIKEAINDKNVLPFHVEYVETLSDDMLTDYLERMFGLPEDTTETPANVVEKVRRRVEKLTTLERESFIEENVYASDDHRIQVVNQVINRSRTKLGLGLGRGESYSSILTVGSIAIAQEYYRLFKEVINGEHDIKVSKRVKQSVTDFPKFAITYSLSENEERSLIDQTIMKEALSDYNEYFDTKYTLESIDAYNNNLAERISRKNDKYKLRDEQIDIVIVVDRLLTGFDAPPLSTLFIDREVMPPHTMIQAFSRTNRLFGGKRANIVTMRKPESYKIGVENAVRMYSGGVEADEILAPGWDEAHNNLEESIEQLDTVLDGVDDILSETVSDEKKKQFVTAFQAVDGALDDISVYSEYMDLIDEDENTLEHEFGISNDELEQYSGWYQDVVKQLQDSGGDPTFYIDMEYELLSRYREDIDYKYIIALMDKYKDNNLTSDEVKEVENYIRDLKNANPRLGRILEQIWRDIQAKSDDVEGRLVIDILEDHKNQYMRNVVEELANDWLLSYNQLEYLVRHYNRNSSSQSGWQTVAQRLRDSYDSSHTYPTDKQPNRLNIKGVARESIFEVIEREIVPLK